MMMMVDDDNVKMTFFPVGGSHEQGGDAEIGLWLKYSVELVCVSEQIWHSGITKLFRNVKCPYLTIWPLSMMYPA